MAGEFEKQLVGKANDLIEQLESGDSQAAMNTIEKLYQARDLGIYQEMGKLTRQVHNAINHFHISESDDMAEGGESKMVDAKDRLQYVIELTENAANKTMDMVEDTVPIAKEVGSTAKRLKGEWQRLMRRELTPDEFRGLYKEVDNFLGFAASRSESIDLNLTSIILAQDYQDLTGQVLKKVINLVREVQDSLVDLLRAASKVETISGVKNMSDFEAKDYSNLDEAHKGLDGPVIPKDKTEEVVTCQDDVDDLLSSLGF